MMEFTLALLKSLRAEVRDELSLTKTRDTVLDNIFGGLSM